MRVLHQSCYLLASAVLLLAAALKWAAGPIEGWPNGTHQVAIIVEGLLAIGLLSGLLRRPMAAVACLTFVLFAGVNVYHIGSGRSACGCFGKVQVSPWVTLAIDLVMAVGLGWSFTKISAQEIVGHKRSRLSIALMLAITGIGVVLWPAKVLPALASLDQLGTVSGNLVVLEPEQWTGKPFALASFIPDSNRLLHGRWVAILHQHDCSVCQDALPKYQAILPTPATQLALIEMPPFADGATIESSGLQHYRLPADHDWFATTPIVLLVQDGIIQREASGEDAADAERVVKDWSVR